MPPVTNLYVLLAREVTTDATDNMNSIIKIIEKFTFGIDQNALKQNNIQLGRQQINLPASYSVATSWLFDEKLKKDTFLTIKLSIINPNGKNLGGPEQEHLIPTGLNKINMNFNAQGLPVTNEGHYTLRAEALSKTGKLLAYGEYPFEVEFTQQGVGV